jgi:hypothetical protein
MNIGIQSNNWTAADIEANMYLAFGPSNNKEFILAVEEFRVISKISKKAIDDAEKDYQKWFDDNLDRVKNGLPLRFSDPSWKEASEKRHKQKEQAKLNKSNAYKKVKVFIED